MAGRGQGGRDCGAELKEWIGRMPAFTRFISICLISTYIASWFFPYEISLLMLDPILAVEYYQVWRIFTCPLVCFNIFSFLIVCCMFLPRSCTRERKQGTTRFVMFFLINNFLGQIIFLLLYYCIWVLPFPSAQISGAGAMQNTAMMARRNGLWVMIMMEMTMRGLENPEAGGRFCFFPCEIKAKYMHWFFFVLISLFQMMPAFQILAGIGLGYLYSWKKLDWTVLSENRALSMQHWFIFGWLKCFANYIATEDAFDDEAPAAPRSFMVQRGDQQYQAPDQPNANAGPQFQAFTGKGYRLDDSDEE